MKARVAVVGLVALMSTAGFGAVTNANAALVPIPAPPAVSEAVAVEVGDLVSVGHSGAGASEARAGASAAPIKVGGEPLLTGTRPTTSSGSDSVLDARETEFGRVTVMPWFTDVNGSQASARSAIDGAIITLGDFTIRVLHAQSNSSVVAASALLMIAGGIAAIHAGRRAAAAEATIR